LPEKQPHDEFLELCALSAAGALDKKDKKRLREHLAVCQSCRGALRDYEVVVDDVMPSIAAKSEEIKSQGIDDIQPGPGWSQERAESIFFKRLAGDERREHDTARQSQISLDRHNRLPIARQGPTWTQVWALYAAGIVLIASFGFYAFRIHRERIANQAAPLPAETPASSQELASLEAQLSDLGHERELAETEVRKRDQLIAELRGQMAEDSQRIANMKATHDRLEKEVQASQGGKQELAHQQSQLQEKLEVSESHSRTVEDKLNALAGQMRQDQVRVSLLESKNADLSRLLEDREHALETQEQLLAHDKDIRDLMGARDLYIAEVYDIARNGEKKKPYGRLFYTRGKSLIFYAYDLDQDADANARTSFQVWGRRGIDRQQALNLGIFYQDNLAHKRWILKCEDSKTLAQIDGVFVTVEPSGGSQKPSGKPLLSAYLKVNPNHP